MIIMYLFDFYSGSYGLFTSLFAAIFGMSFPLILQCIQRIDEKYDSSVVSNEFDKEPSYKLFKWLLFPYIILVCASPLLLGKWANNQILSYAFQCLMLVYMLVISVVMVFLFKRITIYYNFEKFIRTYNVRQPSKDALLCFDLAKYALKKGYQELYIEAMSKVALCFFEERNLVEKGKAVEYSKNLNRILLEIGRTLNTDDIAFEHKFSDITNIIFDSSDDHFISEKTYSLVWYMVNNAAIAGNNEWIRDYWTWAVQYHRFKSNRIENGRNNPEMRKFFLFNIMVGAMLSFNKRFDCLSHLMSFTQSQPYSFPLIPGSISNIMSVAEELDALLEKPMEMEARFQMVGLRKGVNTDKAIFAEAIKYLSILFVRLWSYRDYNIGYCDPLAIPLASNTNIDENENCIRLIELIKKNIAELYNDKSIEELHLSNIPDIVVVTKKIDDIVVSYTKANIDIEKQPGWDERKLQHVFDEAIVHNANTMVPLPSLKDLPVKKESEIIEFDVVGNDSVERRFLQKGRGIECGGIGQGLALDLNLKLRQTFMEKVEECFEVKEISVDQKSIQSQIDAILKEGEKSIVDLGMRYKYEAKGHIYEIGQIWNTRALFICNSADFPSLDIVSKGTEQSGYTLIDKHNLLYGSIAEVVDHYDVSIIQFFSMSFSKGRPKAVLFLDS